MLKKTVTYTDYDGNQRTEDKYFNLTKAEILEMQLSAEGGLDKKIERIAAANNPKEIVGLLKEIVCKSYGVKSDDGKRFIKNEEVLDEFLQSEAYSQLFMELLENPDAAEKFINGIVPRAVAEEANKAKIAQND